MAAPAVPKRADRLMNSMSTARTALLILADGRFPAGGHAHSGGVEAAVGAQRVTGPTTLTDFCLGRLHTTGLTAAALAAAACAGADPQALDTAADARTPSPALRTTARRLGRQLLRVARTTWPSPDLEGLAAAFPAGAHQPLVLGLAARSAGLVPRDAAHIVAYESVSGPAGAAGRLLSLDPLDVTAVLARLATEIDKVAEQAAAAGSRASAEGTGVLPAAGAPLLDITAEQHATRPVRLFAS